MVNVLIKNMDKNVYKLAKQLAVKEEKTVGEVLKEAILSLLEKKKRAKGRLTDLPTFDFGPGNENLSMEIDDVLYGPRR